MTAHEDGREVVQQVTVPLYATAKEIGDLFGRPMERHVAKAGEGWRGALDEVRRGKAGGADLPGRGCVGMVRDPRSVRETTMLDANGCGTVGRYTVGPTPGDTAVTVKLNLYLEGKLVGELKCKNFGCSQTATWHAVLSESLHGPMLQGFGETPEAAVANAVENARAAVAATLAWAARVEAGLLPAEAPQANGEGNGHG